MEDFIDAPWQRTHGGDKAILADIHWLERLLEQDFLGVHIRPCFIANTPGADRRSRIHLQASPWLAVGAGPEFRRDEGAVGDM